MQQELDSLFGCCWRGEAPPEAMADWVLTHLTKDQPLRASYLYLNEDRHDPDWAELYVKDEGYSMGVLVRLQVRNLGVGGSRYIPLNHFASEFPKWFTDQVDGVYEILSK